MMNKFCALFLCSALSLCLVACGAGNNEGEHLLDGSEVHSASQTDSGSSVPTAEPAPPVTQRSMDKAVENHSVKAIQARGTLAVGIVEQNPPFTFWNDDLSRQGMDSAMANTLADELGVTLELFSGTPKELADAVRSGRVDVALGGFAAGDATLKGALETGYYAGGRQVLLCCIEDVRLYPSLSSFGTKTIAYLEALPDQKKVLAELLPTCTAAEMADIDAALRKLRSGTCAALIVDEFQGIAYGQDIADLGVAKITLETERMVEPKVMIVMDENESLASFVNESVIKKYTASGGLGRLMISATTKAANLEMMNR